MIRGREFPNGKMVGRSASEPISSLVTIRGEADPLVKWGRPMSQGVDNGSRPSDLPG